MHTAKSPAEPAQAQANTALFGLDVAVAQLGGAQVCSPPESLRRQKMQLRNPRAVWQWMAHFERLGCTFLRELVREGRRWRLPCRNLCRCLFDPEVETQFLVVRCRLCWLTKAGRNLNVRADSRASSSHNTKVILRPAASFLEF